jgi:hypothetical protein
MQLSTENQMIAYDVIGDVHGQAGKLQALLREMGYVERRGTWTPPLGRQAVFLGDLIDRGPQQESVVRTVRAMVDAGHARCVMGNHEFNAIGFATPDPREPGAFLRRHVPKNIAQHAEFLKQIGEGSPLHREFVEWFRTLPPVLDLGGIRVVHAWWHAPHVDLVTARLPVSGRMEDDFLHAAFTNSFPEWHAMEGLLKGLELELPRPHAFLDHAGVERHEVRARWWREAPASLRDIALVDDDQIEAIPDVPVPDGYLASPVVGSPVFVGHYWMQGVPKIQSPKVACLDWSAAKERHPLVAYRWDGEEVLDDARFVAAM